MANTISANGTTSITWNGGKGFYAVQGTFDSATVDLQYSTDGGTTKTAFGSDTTLTAAGGGLFTYGKGTIYIVTSGGGGSPSVTYDVLPVEGKNFA